MSLLGWQRSIEQIILTSTNARNRVLGLTSVRRGAGVSLVCRHLAKTVGVGGSKALLVDMSEPPESPPINSERQWSVAAIRERIVPSVHGYDLLAGHAGEGDYGLFGNLPRLREMLASEFLDYDRIIVDIPAILDAAETGFNAVAAAAICDRLLLVCAVGTDKRAELSEAVSLLKGAGVAISGVISNEHQRIDAREEIIKLGAIPRRLLRRSA